MEIKEKELIVLYINKEDNSLHQILLNDIENAIIANEISKIYATKNSNVMVSDTKLKIVKEEEPDEETKTNSRKI